MNTKTNSRKQVIKVGQSVRLTTEAAKSHRCPEGRENNSTAEVWSIGAAGEVHLSRDLKGCRHWNVDDLAPAFQYRLHKFPRSRRRSGGWLVYPAGSGSRAFAVLKDVGDTELWRVERDNVYQVGGFKTRQRAIEAGLRLPNVTTRDLSLAAEMGVVIQPPPLTEQRVKELKRIVSGNDAASLLMRWVNHDNSCSVRHGDFESTKCTCGLNKTLKELGLP